MKLKPKQLFAEVLPLTGNVVIPDWAQYVEFVDVNAQLFDLPNPSTHIGKLMVVRNATATAKKLSGNTPHKMFDSLGQSQASFQPNSVTIIGANVTKWDIVSVDKARSPTILEPVVYAKGLVNLGDPTPANSRPITNNFNISTATGLNAVQTNSQLRLNFVSPLPTLDYFVDGEIVSNLPGTTQWQNDATLIWTTHSKTSTGFIVAFRETVALVQNVSFNFQVSGTR